MIARALAFTDGDTGQRPVSVAARQALQRVACGGRLVETRQGYALFDDEGRFVGTIQTPATRSMFGPSGQTMLLNRERA